MNENEANEIDAHDSAVRAAQARARLAEDLDRMVKTGETLVEDSKQAVRKTLPVLAGIGIFGLLVASVMMFTRRSRPRAQRALQIQKRSFLGDALRSAMLSLIGVLAGRLAQRLPLPLPPAPNRRG